MASKNPLDERVYSSDSDNDVTTPLPTDDNREESDDNDSLDGDLEVLSPAPQPPGDPNETPTRQQPDERHRWTQAKRTKSQFSATKWELIRVSANRFTYSKEYILGYILLTIFSVITVGISLATPKGCPHPSFYAFEVVVLLALMAEVGIRMVALRRHFWKSWWNVVDAILMVICAVTLGLVFAGCSKGVRFSRQTSTVLLVIRNIVQVIRIVNLLWRNRNNISNRQVDIDLDTVHDTGFELLPEDEDAEQIWNVDEDEEHRLSTASRR